MAKTQEELNALKKEVETINNKLKELTDEELKQVAGGAGTVFWWGESEVTDSKDFERKSGHGTWEIKTSD